ncbi:hypothetical protein QN277_007696 [Acacia crassicarpa]|uniref:Uncharacterized protein n=1 Tax=Acacia crassicarpa TaxID=499986 RepID=A0AAE1IXX9_9FABA|nr:hypothetical protein QN277_007696 [Acacia crassicarpa]
MVEKANGRKEEVVTREYTINLHKCLHGCILEPQKLIRMQIGSKSWVFLTFGLQIITISDLNLDMGIMYQGVVEQVQCSRLLSYNIDAREIEKLRSYRMDLEESIETLEATSRRLQDEERRLSNEAANLHRQRDEINTVVLKEKEKHRDIMRIVELRKRKLESLAEEGDVDLVIAKLTAEARNCNIQRFRNAIKIKSEVGEEEKDGYRWLEEIEKPENSQIEEIDDDRTAAV